jgi:putative zinc finger/helix-turn-helix YgiT family protein
MKRCPQCGSEDLITTHGDYHYLESGLPNVILKDIPLRRCKGCSELWPVISRIKQLHEVITEALVKKASPLTGDEVRFLRKALRLKARELASVLGVHKVTVSRWETGKEAIGPTADRLLRLMVATRTPLRDYSLDMLKKITRKSTPTTVRLGLKIDKEGWHAIAA